MEQDKKHGTEKENTIVNEFRENESSQMGICHNSMGHTSREVKQRTSEAKMVPRFQRNARRKVD